MTQLLIVADNPAYAEELSDYFIELGNFVGIAGSAAEMWSVLGNHGTEVVVLDLGPPGEDGLGIIPRMRADYPQIGLLVLTAHIAFDKRILGLRLGADHYLIKPIKLQELAAHIEAIDRRIHFKPGRPPVLKWILKIQERRLELNHGAIDLTEKECMFLHVLSLSNRPVSREFLLNSISRNDDIDASRRMDMLVYRLRKKVKNGLGESLPLRTAYGEGYSLSNTFDVA